MADDIPNDAPPEPKPEPLHDDSLSSIGSSPSPNPEQDAAAPEQQPPPQKRKGGRKPIYATSEERKQRNRQAQAAFRERRTEYIKQLETTIKHNEESLQTLQQNHRTAADECLMLRYKNSLLERILLEKGIDVQAELQSKAASPMSRPGMAPSPALGQHGPRASLGRPPPGRRGPQGLAPKIDTGNIPAHVRSETMSSGRSAHSQATSPSQFSSPSLTFTRSPGLQSQADMMSPRSAPLPPQFQQQNLFDSRHPGDPQAFFGSNVPGSNQFFGYPQHNRSNEPSPAGSGPGRPFFQPGYEDPTDPTDPAADTVAEMIDEHASYERYGRPRPFSPDYPQHLPSPAHSYPFPSDSERRSVPTLTPTTTSSSMNIFSAGSPALELSDGFGLSAGMHFPTPFSAGPGSSR